VKSSLSGSWGRWRPLDAELAIETLELIILTAARAGEVLNMVWHEVNLEAAIWKIPAARMKAGNEHIVPLSDAALELLRGQLMARRGDQQIVFPSPPRREKIGVALGTMALANVLRRLGAGDYTTHGFRSLDQREIELVKGYHAPGAQQLRGALEYAYWIRHVDENVAADNRVKRLAQGEVRAKVVPGGDSRAPHSRSTATMSVRRDFRARYARRPPSRAASRSRLRATCTKNRHSSATMARMRMISRPR
jgi:hypothetical protein